MSNTSVNKNFRGISARDFGRIIAGESDPVRRAAMLAHVQERITTLSASHPSRARKWARVASALTAPATVAPVAVVAPKPKAVKRAKAAKPAVVAPASVDALVSQIASSGVDMRELLTALTTSILAQAK